MKLLRVQNLIHFRKIDSQELVSSSDPVRIVMLSLGTFFVNELIYRFVFRLVQNENFVI